MTESNRLTLEERYHREVAKKPYTFPWAGRDWRLPHMAGLDYRIQNKISKFEQLDMDGLEELFEQMIGKDQIDAWGEVEVPGDYLLMVFTDWLEHSGEQPGEDSASNVSSKNTGTKSRRTSGANTPASASRSRSSAKKATPAKRARKKTPTAAELAAQADEEWLAKHQALAGSPPGNSST